MPYKHMLLLMYATVGQIQMYCLVHMTLVSIMKSYLQSVREVGVEMMASLRMPPLMNLQSIINSLRVMLVLSNNRNLKVVEEKAMPTTETNNNSRVAMPTIQIDVPKTRKIRTLGVARTLIHSNIQTLPKILRANPSNSAIVIFPIPRLAMFTSIRKV